MFPTGAFVCLTMPTNLFNELRLDTKVSSRRLNNSALRAAYGKIEGLGEGHPMHSSEE